MVPQVEISNAGNRSKSTYEVQRLQWKLKLEFDLYSVFAIGYYGTESVFESTEETFFFV